MSVEHLSARHVSLRSRRSAGVIGAIVLVFLSACSEGGTGSLPEEFLGQWYYTGSSGGIDGAGPGDAPTGYIVIRRDDTIDHYTEDGAQVETTEFTANRRPTILSTDDLWVLTGGAGVDEVITVAEDGETMSLSQNVYDGFSRSYARSR